MRDFFNFIQNAETGDELFIEGEIVSDEPWWGSNGEVVARRFRQSLARCNDVTVYINSPGGDVFAGAEIYTALKEHKGKITVKVLGIAASAASVIAMAGDEILMSPVSYMMIHDPWTYAMGNAREMEHQAQVLREVGEGLVAAYIAKTGKPSDEIRELLAAETYMSAQTCVDEGFADAIMDFGASEETAKGTATLMRASRYGAAAICAKLRGGIPAPTTPPKDDADPDAQARKDIALRAKLIADCYTTR